MNETAGARRVRQILAAVKPLAAEYYQLTGKPLGVTGEIAEFVAAEILGLELAPPRTPGYDAIRKTRGRRPQRIQIKGRAYGEDAKPGQRLGTIKRGAPCDVVLLVILDNRTLEPPRNVGGTDRRRREAVGSARQSSRARRSRSF